MCGIFAITGETSKAGSKVLQGLKKLEYRGYDSWGVAVREKNGIISVQKDIGKISNVNIDFPESSESIGHSRWATHGGVTKLNAHPHQIGSVTLVHNGIFENYESIKGQFPKYNFKSETDSEVIAALINDFFVNGSSPKKSISKAIKKIEGRFAILVLFEGVPGIFAARKGSPLIIGRSKNKTFIASDIPAFLEQTNTVNYLDDDQMVHIQNEKADFYDLKTQKVLKKRNITVSWKMEDSQKGKYDHFMIKEIFDQKLTIASAINHEENLILKAVKLLQKTNGTYLIACGTSHKMAMAAEYFFADISGKKVNVVPASEMDSFECFINEKTAVIAISQSGETADIMEVVEKVKKKNATIFSLTNVESSSLARISDINIPLNAGPEKAVASTKASTAQMALMFLLAHGVGAGKESIKISDEYFHQKINTGKEVLRDTASSINDLLNPRYEEHIKSIAQNIFKEDKMFIIGRKSLYPMALEAAIKIQEVSYISAMGFAAGELKHGPIALIEDGIPCIVLGGEQETVSNAAELKARGAKIIGISPKNSSIFDEWIRVPDCDGAQSIASIIPVQILAYHLAIFRGIDPDMPRNLAKSVTVK